MSTVLCTGGFLALCQARLGSSRLPGKVLMDIAGRTLLERVAERMQRIAGLDGWAILTSELPSDDPIADYCGAREWTCWRGSERDVLDRYARAARALGARHVLRVTADCPFLSWEQAARVLRRHLEAHNDYTHNLTCWGSGLPIGTGVEAIDCAALERADREGRAPAQREHVTEYLYEIREQLRFECVRAPAELARPDYRLTVDYAADLELARRLCSRAAAEDAHGPVALARCIEILDREPALARANLPAGLAA